MIADAIKFESWDFLASHFNGIEDDRTFWTNAKEAKQWELEEWEQTRVSEQQQPQIYVLSRRFPVFNEDSIQGVKLDKVVEW